MIDFDAPADQDEVSRLLSVVGSGRRRTGGPLTESIGEARSPTPAVAERVKALEEAIERGLGAARSEDRPDPGLADEVVRGARSGLAKAVSATAELTRREVVGLEAVILTDGSRPSLSVRSGFVDLDVPDIGDWDMALRASDQAIRRVIAAVGRVNIPVGPGFAGTCFAVAPGLVATNRHVLEEIAQEQPAGQWTLNWSGQTTIDFVGEEGATTATQVPVVGVAFAGPDAINRTVSFPKLDLAVLRVDTGAPGFPSPVRLEKDIGALGPTRDVYVVGFPGRPQTFFGTSTPTPGTETATVLASVFKWKFGVKKLAPGRVSEVPGNLPNDTKRWVFSHDASTLRGHSGSCIVDLGIDGGRVIGLHFGGVSRAQNWAHAFAALQPTMAPLGVTYV